MFVDLERTKTGMVVGTVNTDGGEANRILITEKNTYVVDKDLNISVWHKMVDIKANLEDITFEVENLLETIEPNETWLNN